MFKTVLGRWWMCYSVSDGFGCCRCFRMFRSAVEGFLRFKIAVNNTQLSQRATRRLSRRTSSFLFSFCCLPSTMLSVISAGWIWGGRVTGVTQHLRLPSHAVLRLVRLNLMHLTFALSFPMYCPQQTFYIPVCLLQVVQVVSIFPFVFSSLICWVFLLCQVVFQVLLACCGKCYYVFHGLRLFCFSECFYVIFWGSLMVWCVDVKCSVCVTRSWRGNEETHDQKPTNRCMILFSPGSILTTPSQ